LPVGAPMPLETKRWIASPSVTFLWVAPANMECKTVRLNRDIGAISHDLDPMKSIP
jgi:hypothetical protein